MASRAEYLDYVLDLPHEVRALTYFDGKNGFYNAIYNGDEKSQRYFKDRFEGVKFFI